MDRSKLKEVNRRAWDHADIPIAAALAVLLVVVVGLYVQAAGQTLPEELGGKHVELLPTTGEEGYNATAFCEDELTTLKVSINPDSLDGFTFDLNRLRDNVEELVTFQAGREDVGLLVTGDHFAIINGIQVRQTAIITPATWDCINGKSG